MFYININGVIFMLAKERLNHLREVEAEIEPKTFIGNLEVSEKEDISVRERVAKIQITYLNSQIRHYTNSGLVKCYNTLEYILPEVLSHFHEKGFGLCQDKITWKNATFGEALDCYEIANRAFLKKVVEEISYMQKNGYKSTFKFSASHIHCKKAIKILEDLGYHIFTKGKQLIVSVKHAKESTLNGHIISLPSAIEVKKICYDRQKQIIDDLIENSVNEGLNEVTIPLKYDLKEFLSEVREHYIATGYVVNEDTISWDHTVKDEHLDTAVLNNIYSKIRRDIHLKSVAIIVKQYVTIQVIEKLLADGYDVYTFSDATLISWENADANQVGKRHFSSEKFSIDKVSATFVDSILLQLRDYL